MIMEICNNNLIIAIYSCKMGTCKKDGKNICDVHNNENGYNNIGITQFNIVLSYLRKDKEVWPQSLNQTSGSR